MKIDKAVERLAFIKYLYKIGVEQSMKTEPFCWASILMFHDSIELFLELASEYLDAHKQVRDLRFLKYWDVLNPILRKSGKSELTHRVVMDKLNRTRVALKHHGTPPSKSTIENARVNTTDFFEENTPIIFDIEFPKISLIELVGCKATKESLREAQELLKENKIEESLIKISLGFAQLIDDYEVRKVDTTGRSPFAFSKLWGFSTFLEGMDDVEGYFDEITEAVESLQERVRILSLGLDYRRYVKFKSLTPVVVKKGKHFKIKEFLNPRSKEVTLENTQFCINFVIESAITLQEFDFELKGVRQRSLSELF